MRRRLDEQAASPVPQQTDDGDDNPEFVPPVAEDEVPVINNLEVSNQIPHDWGTDWREPIRNYILHGVFPPDNWAARKLKATSARFCIANDILYRRLISAPDAICIFGEQTRTVIKEIHDGTCGNHSGGRCLAFKVKKYGYF